MNAISDTVMTLAAVALFAKGPTVIETLLTYETRKLIVHDHTRVAATWGYC